MQARGGVIGVCARIRDMGQGAQSAVRLCAARAPTCSRGWRWSAEEVEMPPFFLTTLGSFLTPEQQHIRTEHELVHRAQPRAALARTRHLHHLHAMSASSCPCALANRARCQVACKKIEAQSGQSVGCGPAGAVGGSRQAAGLLVLQAQEDGPRAAMVRAASLGARGAARAQGWHRDGVRAQRFQGKVN